MPINCVTVAGHPLTDYGAHMQANPVISHSRDVETFQGRQRSTMRPIKNLITGMQLTARIDFIGTASVRAMNRSMFEALFRSQTNPVEIDILDGFFYRAVLISEADCGTAFDLINTVEYVWNVTRHTAPKTISLTSENRIYCTSNYDRTDCCVEISAGFFGSSEILTVKINGYDWWIDGANNPNEERIVLDGINKVFLIGSTNAASLITWTDFPFLVPGLNVIEIYVNGFSTSGLNGVVTYTPTFL